MKKFILLFLTIPLLYVFPDVINNLYFYSEINWSELYIKTSISEKLPPLIQEINGKQKVISLTEARKQARIKASTKAESYLYHSIENIILDHRYTIREKLDSNQSFRQYFQVIQNPDNYETDTVYKDNLASVEIIQKITGKYGILAHIDYNIGDDAFPQFSGDTEPEDYTGVIIDARNIDLAPGLLPALLTENGLEVYSYRYVNKRYMINNGLAIYMNDPKKALKHKRAGTSPYYIKALSVSGKYGINPVISYKDARIMLSSDKTRDALKKCNLIILLKK